MEEPSNIHWFDPPRTIKDRLQVARAEIAAPKQDGVQRLVDIEQKMAEGKGRGYERWAKIHNLKQAAKTLSVYQQYGFTSPELSVLLGLTEDSGAVLSQGSDALTPAQNMNLITSASRNWVGFTTLYVTEVAEASALASWADIDDDYVYFDWSTDTKMLDQSTQSTTKAALLAESNYNCLAMVYGTAQDAAAFLPV